MSSSWARSVFAPPPPLRAATSHFRPRLFAKALAKQRLNAIVGEQDQRCTHSATSGSDSAPPRQIPRIHSKKSSCSLGKRLHQQTIVLSHSSSRHIELHLGSHGTVHTVRSQKEAKKRGAAHKDRDNCLSINRATDERYYIFLVEEVHHKREKQSE